VPGLVRVVSALDRLNAHLLPANVQAQRVLKSLDDARSVEFAPPTALIVDEEVDGDSDEEEEEVFELEAGDSDEDGDEEDEEFEDEDVEEGEEENEVDAAAAAKEAAAEDPAVSVSSWRYPQGDLLYRGFVTSSGERHDVWLRLHINLDQRANERTKKARELAIELKKRKRHAKGGDPWARMDAARLPIYSVTGYGVVRAGPRRVVVRGSATASGRIAAKLEFLPLPTDEHTGERPPPPVLLLVSEAGEYGEGLSGACVRAADGAKQHGAGEEKKTSAAVFRAKVPRVRCSPVPNNAVFRRSGVDSSLGFSLWLAERDQTPGSLVSLRQSGDSKAPTDESLQQKALVGAITDAVRSSSGSRSEEAIDGGGLHEALSESTRHDVRDTILFVQRMLVISAASAAQELVRGPRVSYEEE